MTSLDKPRAQLRGDRLAELNFVKEGYAVASRDCRGQAGKSEDNSLVMGKTRNEHVIPSASSTQRRPHVSKPKFRQLL
jgi:cephalosporin-C deacetylase-like acetyl esterase